VLGKEAAPVRIVEEERNPAHGEDRQGEQEEFPESHPERLLPIHGVGYTIDEGEMNSHRSGTPEMEEAWT
jgi:hypothetical protein